jgi:hypothetical protein
MSIVIKRIDEPDFGCEGAPDNKPICDRVTIAVEDNELVLNVPEKVVWDTKIDEGMEISTELFDRLKSSAVV